MSVEISQLSDPNSNLVLLMEQYKNSPRLKGILESANQSGANVERAFFEVRDLFWIHTAEGKQLDVIGDILHAKREGRDDSEFRSYLLSIALSSYSGTPPQLIDQLKNIHGFSKVIYIPEYPAGYVIMDLEEFNKDFTELDSISPAGVRGVFGYPIAQGDLTLEEPWLIDAKGNVLICSMQWETNLLVNELGENFITDSGEEIEILTRI